MYSGLAGSERRWCAFVFALLLAVPSGLLSDDPEIRDPVLFGTGKDPGPERSPVLDGSSVHNIGRLQMNVTNWGFLGSLPKSRYDMAEVPSAQYPAGSGIEYLYAAGIWVGAEKNGIPFVSTGYPETEFYPEKDPRDIIYRTQEGDSRGGALPSPADDDEDGRIDEDFLNGYDDDGDGWVDEDFAALGKQMFTCQFYDDLPMSRTVWPEHEPLGIRIRQETFQWGEEQFQDFIGVRYTIKNMGYSFLTNLYVGIYADLDAGPREYGSYHMDDQVGFYRGDWCAVVGNSELPVEIHVAYVYDGDGDDGRTPSYFGFVLLGHSTDPNMRDGLPYYPSTIFNAFRTFRGLAPFINGGDATNDYERYDVLSTRQTDPNTQTAADYRVLMSVGPFWYLPPDKSFFVDFAFVGGDDLNDLLDSAAAAKWLWYGTWYDLDRNRNTGVNTRESIRYGPLKDFDPDYCDEVEEKLEIERGDSIWSNNDCFLEMKRNRLPTTCYRRTDIDRLSFATGLGGREHQLNWVTSSAPAAPNLRVVPRDHSVEVFWDNLSELIPDQVSQLIDFEGYQIWRADDWHRPSGTTESTGPRHELWSLLETGDLLNGVAPDVGFAFPEEEGGWIYTPLKDMKDRQWYLDHFEMKVKQFPADTLDCPVGLTEEVCDTLEAIARWNLGYDGGKRYYRYVDNSAKNGLPYFYAVTAYDHNFLDRQPYEPDRYNSPSSNFVFTRARTEAQTTTAYEEKKVYVVPNPVTSESMEPWRLEPNNADATGLRCEFRNLPRCNCTIRIYTISADLVQVIHHNGSEGDGTAEWNLVSRNGQNVTSGVYIFGVEPESSEFPKTIGKFVIIR
jgi:hypothetical protein